MTQSEYKEAQAKCGILPGDYVLVTHKAPSFTNGWSNTWIEDMNYYVGKIVRVHSLAYSSGVKLETGHFGYNYSFPFFILKKIDKLDKLSSTKRDNVADIISI